MSDYEPSQIFLNYLLDKSYSKNISIAKKEWEYCGQIIHLEGIQSTCFLEPSLNKYSIAFYNIRTDQIFHANSKTQYFLHNKGSDRDKIVITDPNGNGNSDAINKGMLNKIKKVVLSVYNKHNLKNVSVEDIRQLSKYKYLLTNIKIKEQDELNKILFKINWLIDNFYNINFCESCSDFYLSKVKQTEFRPKCLKCYNSNDVCFLKLINNK